MKNMLNNLRFLALILTAIIMPTTADANGFYIQEMTASGMAQGGATVAAGNNPSNQFTNAANLAYSQGFWIEGGFTTYIPIGYYQNPVTGVKTFADDSPQFVPSIFASYKVNDWLAVGIAEFTSFGLAINWPRDWEGNHKIISSSMQTFTINPNIAFGPFKGFSIALGFDAMYGNFEIQKALTLGMTPTSSTALDTVSLQGEAWGFGANIGLMYQPVDWVRIGLAYRTGIKIESDKGYADFDVSAPWAAKFPDQRFGMEINLPHTVFMGVRFWPTKGLSLELDAQWVQWSVWNKLDFNLADGIELGPEAKQMTLSETSNYKDAWQIRLGGEYKFFNNHFAFRFGFLWDQNPATSRYLSPMLPDSERVMPCIGFGTEWHGFFVDVAYMPVFTLKRTVTWEGDMNDFPGTYENVTHDVTISLGYHFNVVNGKARIPTYGEDAVLDEDALTPQPETISEPAVEPSLETNAG